MFMTPIQLKQLSGGHTKKRVIQWLDDNGYKYQIGLDGWPRVLVTTVKERLGVKETVINAAFEPDLSWME